MAIILGIFTFLGIALLGALAEDLLLDAPRLAVRIARFSTRMLRSTDRQFFGWEAEIEAASRESVAGQRSRISVLFISLGMMLTACKRRVSSDALEVRSDSTVLDLLVKLAIPLDFDLPRRREWVWAIDVGKGLYRIDNHVLFSELTCCGDVVRAEVVSDEDFEWLEFQEVYEETTEIEVDLCSSWRLLPSWRRGRLIRRLRFHGMTSEWISPRCGRGTLPSGHDLKKVRRLLRRRRVRIEQVERSSE